MNAKLPLLIIAGSIVAIACGGSDSTEPNNTPTRATVTQVGLFPGAGTTPCTSAVTMNFTVQVLNGKVGDAVVVSLTGPGLPATINENLTASSQLITKQYPVAQVGPGQSAVWTALVLSVGGQTPDTIPGGRRTAQSSASC
jgi:hypothetical protein